MSQLDPALNKVPETIRHIHFMGICGTGMGAMAGMLQESGYQVTGSDQQVYPPMSDFLAGRGIQVIAGYRPENLAPAPDLVVVGNVIRRTNPEAEELARLKIPYLSFPQALGCFFLQGKTSLVVAGTHGKTTTSSILASLLHEAGQEPGFMIGGIVQAFNCNYHLGAGRYFVVEGDEYDTAFFDKGPKFLHYRPQIAIITSIEFDHADIYADLAAVKRSFARLVEIMPADGCIVAHLDDPVVREVVQAAKCQVIGYGEADDCAFQLGEVAVRPSGTSFSVFKKGKHFADLASAMPGRHNALNILSVAAVLDRIGIGAGVIAAGLLKFKGVRRRQEVRGVVREITVIDDFAHHPTAVRATLAALRGAYAGRRLVAVFEPRTNSSRRQVFQQDYVSAFDAADQVVIKEAEPLQNVPADQLFSCRQLVDDLCERGIGSRYFADTDSIISWLAESSLPGDVIAILSNGGFDNIHRRLLERLATGR